MLIINIKNDGMTPLIKAASNGIFEIGDYLIKKGSDIKATDDKVLPKISYKMETLH